MSDDITGRTASDIAASIRDLVLAGRWPAGSALPPIRVLARQLDVNRNTVAAAYRQLVAAGVAETRGRGGTIVREVPQVVGEGAPAAALHHVDLASGNPDSILLPDLEPVLSDLPWTPVLYGSPAIDGDLLAWATDWFATTAGVPADAQIVLAHGAVDGIERVLDSYLTRGDAVAVEDPCFLANLATLQLNGYRSRPVPVDDEGMTVAGLQAALQAGARAVLITSRAHNPTGASVTERRAEQLQALLGQHPAVLIVEDDHFSAISNRPFHRVAPPEAHRWALIRSVSKFLGPDLRLAFVATDHDTASRLETRLNGGTAWVSHLLQRIVLRLVTDPATATLLNRARETYSHRSTTLIEGLAARGLHAQPTNPDGLNAWLPLCTPSQPIIRELRARGWVVRPGEVFSSSSDAPHDALRVTTSTLTPSQASGFADDLAKVLTRPRTGPPDAQRA